jgi:hypothetical protein
MNTVALSRRRVLWRRRLAAASAAGLLCAAWLAFVSGLHLYHAEPKCLGVQAAADSLRCAAAVGCAFGCLLLAGAGVALPTVLLGLRWLRRRARVRSWRSTDRSGKASAADSAVDSRPDGRLGTALRVRVPSRRRRGAAWALALLPGAASWGVIEYFHREIGNTLEARRVFGLLALPFAYWLLEESRFHPKTLALLVPALVAGHWNLLLWLSVTTSWRIGGFAP